METCKYLRLKNDPGLLRNSRKKIDIFLTKSAFKKQRSSPEKWLRTGGSPLGYVFGALFQNFLIAFIHEKGCVKLVD